MNADERRAFIKRAIDTFGCTENDFDVSRTDGNKHRDPQSFTTLSADVLPLNRSTTLPRLHGSDDDVTRRVIFGVITSNIDRVGGVLDDLSHIPGSFVMIFANGDDSLADAIKVGLRLRGISESYVLNKQSQAVNMILGHCTDVDASCTEGQLPIALARTVLQVFIFNILPELQQANAGLAAVAILDDDKRLGQGWSPFSGRRACIQIGRDCRTPPNPSLFSLRTNLIDLLHSLDLLHSQDGSANDFCIASEHYESRDTFDWYYDMSTSNYSHLELPVYSELAVSREPEPAMDGSFANDDASGEKGVNKLRDYDKLYRDFLIGTPLCRDVIPPLEGGRTSQRGGCMVLIDDFTPLAVQQHAPLIRFSDGSTSYTRRSDSLWCQVSTTK